MKILHIAESAQGGVGTYLAEIIPFQQRQFGVGHIMLLAPDRHAACVGGIDRHSLVTWRRRGRSILSLLRLTWAIRGAIRRFAPDVVHAHSSFAGAIVRLLYGWRTNPFRIIYCPHGWGFDRQTVSTGNRLFAVIERSLARWCDRIIVISDHERAMGVAAGIPAQHLHLVLNGISDASPRCPSRWNDQRLKVLFVGRLDPQKGFDSLLDAVEPFADTICLRAIGKSVAGSAFSRRASTQVDYLGWRSLDEVANEIAAADVVAIPSRWEGFGLVALEAMRAGCAVVASDVGGLREIVREGRTGHLVPPDCPEHLGRVLSTQSRAAWHAMGRAGRQRFVEHFTAERMNQEIVELYHQMLPDRPPVTVSPWRGRHAHA